MLIGHLCKDAELRTTPSGKNVASCSIATNKKYKDQSGQLQSVSQFHNLVIWGNQADTFAKYTKKGSKVYVEGELNYRSYDGKDGVKKFITEIIVNNFEFLDSKPQEKEPLTDKEIDNFKPEEKETSENIPF